MLKSWKVVCAGLLLALASLIAGCNEGNGDVERTDERDASGPTHLHGSGGGHH